MRKRILVADDNDQFRRSLVMILDQAGYSVEEAENGKQALARVKTTGWQFDFIISELQMPDMDGLQLLTEVKGIDPQLLFSRSQARSATDYWDLQPPSESPLLKNLSQAGRSSAWWNASSPRRALASQPRPKFLTQRDIFAARGSSKIQASRARTSLDQPPRRDSVRSVVRAPQLSGRADRNRLLIPWRLLESNPDLVTRQILFCPFGSFLLSADVALAAIFRSGRVNRKNVGAIRENRSSIV